ncbi:hypothetical protein MG293_006497 [Ovis ammon polii]|uniref:Uncharacterized protein n=1 Tax=Ovis ammon polii TaxID=230172 RepID=A0AAD4YD97_OVIAM|nr:hypothetical protein MG293_006497 [Ovis ammon polii]
MQRVLRLADFGSTGRDCGLGTISADFMMGSDSTDAFQVALQEADLEEPEQKRKDRVDLCGFSSWFGQNLDEMNIESRLDLQDRGYSSRAQRLHIKDKMQLPGPPEISQQSTMVK